MKFTTIYMADDDKDDRNLFLKAITQVYSNFNLCLFQDGVELLGDLIPNKGDIPDIIFLDVNMPRKNGVETLSEIRSNPATAAIPVVICSTGSDSKLVDTVCRLGASLYFVKPVSFTHLKQKLSDILSGVLTNPTEPITKADFLIS